MDLKKIAPPVIALLTLIVGGTMVYRYLEHWSYVDSLYFTTTTITTIGLGDLHPSTDVSKLFTVFLALAGVSVGLYSLSMLGRIYYEEHENQLVRMQRRFLESERFEERKFLEKLEYEIKEKKEKFRIDQR